MSNRCYLYSLNALPRESGMTAIGLSEAENEIPLIYKILVSRNPKTTKSIIFESEENIAITADYEGGVRALEAFAQKLGDEDCEEESSKIFKIIDFLKDEQNAQKYIHIECGEIFEMADDFEEYADEMDFLTVMNERFLEEISHIDSLIDHAVAAVKLGATSGLETLGEIPWTNELFCMPAPQEPPANRVHYGTEEGQIYLYSLSALPSEENVNVITLSSFYSAVPLIFKILVSQNPKLTETIINERFEKEGKIAITADYEKGLEELKRFFDKASLRLKEYSKNYEGELVEFMTKVNKLLSFLEDSHNKQKYIHLECADSLYKGHGEESLEERTRAFLSDFEYLPFFIDQEIKRIQNEPYIKMDALDLSYHWSNERHENLLKDTYRYTDCNDEEYEEDDDEDFYSDEDFEETDTCITGTIEDAYAHFTTVRIEPPSGSVEMLKTPINQEQSNCAMDFEYQKLSRLSLAGEDNVLDSVNFYNAIIYCNALSITCNLEPCYSVDGETNPKKWQLFSQNPAQKNPEIVFDKGANGWRLSTKEEWLFCAGKLPKSRDWLDDLIVYRKNSKYLYLQVADKNENKFGLYDMYGLVWEWVWSDEDENGKRLLLGGSWRSTKEELLSEKWAEPMLGDYDFGFRICRNAGTELPEDVCANVKDWDNFTETGKRLSKEELYWANNDKIFGTPSDEENKAYLNLLPKSIIKEPHIMEVGKRKAPCGVFYIVEDEPFAVEMLPKEVRNLAFCRILFFDKNKNIIDDVEFDRARFSLTWLCNFNHTVRFFEVIDKNTYIIFKKGLSLEEIHSLLTSAYNYRKIDDAGFDAMSKKTISDIAREKIKSIFHKDDDDTEQKPITQSRVLDVPKKEFSQSEEDEASKIDANDIIQEMELTELGKEKARCGVFHIVEDEPFAVEMCPKEARKLAFCRIVFLDKYKNIIGDVDFNRARFSLMKWEKGSVRYNENIKIGTCIIFKKGLSLEEMKFIIATAEPFRNIDDAGYDELSKKTIKDLVTEKVKSVLQNIQQLKTEKVPYSKKTSKMVLDEVKKRSKTSVLNLTAEKCESAEQESIVFTTFSKFGGYPYWKKGAEFPTDENGRKMILLAQLNFERMYLGNLPDFPTTGILQFFISPYDDESGFDYNNPLSQKNWRVVYHKKIGNALNVEKLKAMGVKTAEDFRDTDGVYLPFYDTFELDDSEDTDYINPCCEERFERLVRDVIKDLGLKEPEESTSVDEIFDKKVYEEYWNECNEGGHKVGGYPMFCQGDARDRSDELKDHDVLLLQIDTDEGIMWGDSGVANFFIKREDLRNLDFSNVFYTWDCC